MKTIEEFKEWTRAAIRPIFPHRALKCGYGRLYSAGVVPDYIVAVDYPLEHLQRIANPAGGIECPVLRRWLATREPQLFEAADPWADRPEEWFRSFLEHGMENTAAHGVYDTKRCVGTYFSFHRIPGRLERAHVGQLQQVVAVMHEALCGVIERFGADSRFAAALSGLNERESEIVRALKQGKSNSEIADLANMSESTVKHYATRIFRKLGVDSRARLLHRLAEHEAASGHRIRIL